MSETSEPAGSHLTVKREIADRSFEWRLAISITSNAGTTITYRSEAFSPSEVRAWRAFLTDGSGSAGRDFRYSSDGDMLIVDLNHDGVALSMPREALAPLIARALEIDLAGSEPQRGKSRGN